MYSRHNKISKFLIYIEILLIIYQSGTVQAAINANTVSFIVLRIAQILIVTAIGIKGLMNYNALNTTIISTVLLEALAFLNWVLYPNAIFQLQYRIVLIVLFYGMVRYCTIRNIDILEIFYNIIFVIAFYTIIFYIIIGFLKIRMPYSMMHIPGGVYYKNYFNLFYSYSIKTIPRICGLFWEPGVYQIYLNLGLFCYLKLEKKNLFQLSVLISNILFTQSTTGYMIATILCGVIIIRSKYFSRNSKIILKLMVPIFSVVLVLLVYSIKKLTTNISGDSYNVRIMDISNSLKLFMKSPLVGLGFYNTNEFMRLNDFKRGNSNGLLTWLYTTGIIGMVFALYPFFYNIKKSSDKKERLDNIIFLVYALMINLSEPIYNLAIMTFVMAFEYFNAFNKKKKRLFQ